MKVQHILSCGICAVMLILALTACQGPTGAEGPQGPKGDPGGGGGGGSNGGGSSGGYITLPHVHIWDEWVITSAPTASTNGSERKTCTSCGTSETRAIPSSITVRDLNGWNSALTTIRGGGNSQSYTICILDDIIGVTQVYSGTINTAGFGTVTGLTVTLRGKGVLIKLDSGGNMFRLGSGQKLIIDGGLTLQPADRGEAIVYVQTGGILELKDGTLTGNSISASSTADGGGVYVDDGGDFIMNGGEISGNVVRTSSNNNSYYGSGGGVYVNERGTFTMNGGVISGNLARTGSGSPSIGGGVCVYNGTFTMNGGEIGGNFANNGGGVYVYNGTFTMNGGVITGNNSTSNTNSSGGGVYVSSGTFRIANGTLYRNSANNGAELYLDSAVAEYGTFNGSNWRRTGYLITTNNTIRVVNGVLQ